MTRFARAKGSKASNERVVEEATPWHELKSQMTTAYDVEDLGGDDIEVSDDEQPQEESKEEVLEIEEEEPEHKLELSELQKVSDLLKKKRKRSQNNCLNCKKPGHLKKECPELSEDRRKELQDLFQMKIERKGQGTGRKKNKKRKLTESLDKENKDDQSDEGNKDKDQNSGPSPSKKSKKSKKEKRKRPVKDKSGQIVQDGEGLFQGFRVLKEDVDRLRLLHDKLQKEKVPEMQEILKKERRKAEKILANSKKNVCFQCRQPGHVLSDCPQTVHKTGKTGKCFKCGSAAHSSKECQSKLKGADAYRFAECFVCGQAGHLAKACPDNPRGLYPKGGGCRFCGSVEHLKSDCPRKVEKDAKNQVRLQRQVDQGIEEVVDNSVIKHRKVMKKQKMSKVVNF